MTGQIDRSQDHATCQKLINLGYARSNRVRLYGLEVQLISDPFPQEDGGFAVEVKDGNDARARTMRLPLSVLQVARTRAEKRSA